ncbi:26S proteasome non-ATPase regulatory subunit 12 [Gossypium australe]|uniref:26S proteasome non-ATPase regulatory subunit 12 n=1 Tax=Gossypium australe TaxID=47621 RepID=A0A5B6V668_9ROSI|nr:26S proteasome non-ATPase regulatory subunit 12 [Gossypium australe]
MLAGGNLGPLESDSRLVGIAVIEVFQLLGKSRCVGWGRGVDLAGWAVDLIGLINGDITLRP